MNTLETTTTCIMVYMFLGSSLSVMYKGWLSKEHPKDDFTIIDFLAFTIFWLPIMIYAWVNTDDEGNLK